MLSRRNFQRSFKEYVLNSSAPSMIASHFKSPKFSGEEILALHRNNFRITLIDTLASIFPAIKQLVGEECFEAHARLYVEQYPPTSPVLSVYGGSFPQFLGRQLALAELPYLKDMALLEWQWNKAFHSEDAEILTPEELQEAATRQPDDLTFILHPSARLVTSDYPILSIWLMALRPEDHVGDINLDSGPDYLLVLRPQNEVTVSPIDIGTHAMLHALAQGHDFYTATKKALEISPCFSLEGSLGSLLIRGTFVSFNS